MPYYHYTLTKKSICPKCQKTLERNEQIIDGNDGCLRWLAYIMCFPIALIVLLIRQLMLVKRKVIGRTMAGHTVAVCPRCKSNVVFIDNSTRLLFTEEEMLNLVMPSIRLLQECNIKCGKVRQKDNSIEETVVLEFFNNENDKKCRIAVIMGEQRPIIFDYNVFTEIVALKRDLDTRDSSYIMQNMQKLLTYRHKYYDYAKQHYYSHEMLLATVMQELL